MRPILEVNGVRLNAETREAVSDGIPVDLTSVEFEILQVLMGSAGLVVSRDELARSLSERVPNQLKSELDIHVNSLKPKLERGRRLIVKVGDAGYLFATADKHGASDYQLA